MSTITEWAQDNWKYIVAAGALVAAAWYIFQEDISEKYKVQKKNPWRILRPI